MTQRNRFLLAGLMSAIPALALAAPASAPVPPSVTVVTATDREIVERAIVSGSLTAREEILVGARIDGLAITEILAEEATV